MRMEKIVVAEVVWNTGNNGKQITAKPQVVEESKAIVGWLEKE